MILTAGLTSAGVNSRITETRQADNSFVNGPNYAIVSNEEERISLSITATRQTSYLADFMKTFKMPARYEREPVRRYEREPVRRRYDRRIFPQ